MADITQRKLKSMKTWKDVKPGCWTILWESLSGKSFCADPCEEFITHAEEYSTLRQALRDVKAYSYKDGSAFGVRYWAYVNEIFATDSGKRDPLTENEIEAIIDYCRKKVDQYLKKENKNGL